MSRFHRLHLSQQASIGARRLALTVDLLLHGCDVGEDELELEGLKRSERVGVPRHLGVHECTHDEEKGVDLADPAEESVAETLSGRRTGDEPGDVDHLDSGAHDLSALAHLERVRRGDGQAGRRSPPTSRSS